MIKQSRMKKIVGGWTVMNPDYKQISASDASKMLGVHKTSVTNWCKAGMINFIDVSEPGSARPRYVIPEDVRAVCHDVLRHRIGLTYEAEAENVTTENIITEIINTVEVP